MPPITFRSHQFGRFQTSKQSEQNLLLSLQTPPLPPPHCALQLLVPLAQVLQTSYALLWVHNLVPLAEVFYTSMTEVYNNITKCISLLKQKHSPTVTKHTSLCKTNKFKS